MPPLTRRPRYPSFRIFYKNKSLQWFIRRNMIYIAEMMQSTSMIPRRQDLRLASRCDLIIPKHRAKFAEHTFIVAGPVAWNRLLQTIREASSLITFRRVFKHICLRLLTQTVAYVQCHCRVRSLRRYINTHFKLH